MLTTTLGIIQYYFSTAFISNRAHHSAHRPNAPLESINNYIYWAQPDEKLHLT